MKKTFTLLTVLFTTLVTSAQTSNAWNLQGSGTESDPYKISSVADFKSIADNISATNTGAGEYFSVTEDINFGGTADSPVQFPAIGKAGITSVTSVAWGFDGILDGGNHTITGIYHTNKGNDADGKFNALFSSLGKSGIIRNLVFGADNHVESYNYAAAIASLSKGRIENCVNKADITASNAFAAGICGYLVGGAGEILSSDNYGEIKAMTYAAGILGGSQSGASITNYEYLVESCINYGNLSTTNSVGSAGIAAAFSGSIKNCVNEGDIVEAEKTTGNYTGGIVASYTYIVLCEGNTNKGSITGNKNVGGIIGVVMKGDDANAEISGCVNEGTVTGRGANIGGILANSSRVSGVITLANCKNSGAVTTTADDKTTIGNLRGSSNIAIGEGNTIADGLEHLALDPESLGITNVSAIQKIGGVKKYIANGKVIILKNNRKYTLSGSEIE
ncbi:MAG: hypothetical protein ACI4V5_00075 [Prevotella sp.]